MSTKATILLNKWATIAQYWLLPGTCVVCRQSSGVPGDLCSVCADALIRVELPCYRCGLPLPPGHTGLPHCGACTTRHRAIARTVAPFAWQAPVAQLVSGYKYRACLQHGRVLGTLLLAAIEHQYHGDELPQLLLPVPLHPHRLRERGYNQALLLAQQLGSALNIPVCHSLLRRVRATTPQQGLSAVERRRNLRGAFAVDSAALPSDVSRIALVDDVITTMSTLDTLARLLQRQLPRSVELQAWALARA